MHRGVYTFAMKSSFVSLELGMHNVLLPSGLCNASAKYAQARVHMTHASRGYSQGICKLRTRQGDLHHSVAKWGSSNTRLCRPGMLLPQFTLQNSNRLSTCL